MATKSASYNAVLRSLKKDGLSHTQARAAWKGIKERLGHSPTARELKAHPKITAQEIKRAPARERAIRGAATRALNKAAKTAPPVKPGRPTKGGGEAKGGAGGGRPIIPRDIALELDAEWENFDMEWEDDDPYGG